MTITDPWAIQFCNEEARPLSDLLAQSYYLADAVKDRWDGLGGGQPAIDIMESDIRRAADRIVIAYARAFHAEKMWFLGLNITIPNTSEPIADGSPDDGRPAATGEVVHGVMARAIQFQNWLFSSTASFTDPARDNAGPYNTVISASSSGDPTMSVPTAGNFIDNRCVELRDYNEASSNLNLNALLIFSVNPQSRTGQAP